MRFDTAVVGAVAAASGVSAQLHELAVRAGLKYWGTTMDNGYRSDAPYMAILNDKSEHGQLVPENGQKWAYVQPTRGQFTYTNADVVPNIAIANGQILRCHAFVWHSQLPNWVANGNWSPDELKEIITSHINNVGAHYKGKCYAWDVVNEAAADDGNWRDSVFYRVLGAEYLPFSFKAAKAVDPDTKLYYNDYNLEYNGAKTDRVVEFVKIIQEAGAPIDGVGFQGHLIVGSTPGRSALATALRRFTALGVEVAYTELDIRHSSVPANAAANQRQASDYANVVGSCLDVDNCIGVTVWGFTDKYSWIPNTFQGAGEALIYDKDFNKKPAWTAVSSVLAAAATGQPPVTSTTSRPPPPSTTLVSSTRTSSSPPQSSTAPPTGTVPRWGQCGGRNWTGPTVCQAPWTCKVSNEWYSQCL